MNSLESVYRHTNQKVCTVESVAANLDNYCYQFVTRSIVNVRERLLAMPAGSWLFWDLDYTLWVDDVYMEERTCHSVYGYLGYRLVENEVIGIINELKRKGVYVLGLTRRVSNLHIETSKDLLRLGVTFSQSLLPDALILKNDNKYPALHKLGVIYTSDFKKGEVVIELLNRAKMRSIELELPPEIGLIDDLMENLIDVRTELKEAIGMHIPFLEINYIGVDKETLRAPKEMSDETKKEIAEKCLLQ